MLLRKYWKLLLLTFISFGIFWGGSQVTNQFAHADNTDNQSVTVQINYLDTESGQTISPSTSITGNAGTPYHITPQSISNYKFFGSSELINGTFTPGTNVINMYYDTPEEAGTRSNSSNSGATQPAQSPTSSQNSASNSTSPNNTGATKNNSGTLSNSSTNSAIKKSNNTTNSTNTNKPSNKNGSDKSETNNTNDKNKVKKSDNKKKTTINKTDKKSDKQDKKTKSSKTPWIITIIVLVLAGAVGGFVWHRSHKPEHFKH